MHFLSFDERVFMFIEKPYGSKAAIRFNDKNARHVRRVSETDALFGETEIHLILDLIDHDDTVSRNPALDLKEEGSVQRLLVRSLYKLRLREEPVGRRYLPQRGMRGIVIGFNKSHKRTPKFIKGMKVPDIKGGHPGIA